MAKCQNAGNPWKRKFKNFFSCGVKLNSCERLLLMLFFGYSCKLLAVSYDQTSANMDPW